MEEFIRNWLASWTGGNPEKLLSFYHEEIKYRDPAYPQGIKGKANLKNYLDKLLKKNPDWIWRLVHMDQVSSTRFYVKWEATIPKGNQVVTEYGLDLVDLKDGLIICNEVYFNPSVFLKRD